MQIQLKGYDLTIKDLEKISLGACTVVIDKKAIERINRCRDYVENLASEERAIYGINTGFGPLCNERVNNKDLKQHQINLLHHLSTGQGQAFSEIETRAIMTARANALCKGYSGIRKEVIELLLNMLNKEVHPIIPQEGSVGASGDLVPLAHMARTLIGLGEVVYKGKKYPAIEGLKIAGLKPVELRCKEGLALVNGTSAMSGIGALAVNNAESLLNYAEVVAAFYVEIFNGSPEVFCQMLQRARGQTGQIETGKNIASLLKTNPSYASLIENHKWGTGPKPIEAGIDIQDPYSLRCSPQIIGAIRDALYHVKDIITKEINAATDNPLIFPKYELVSHGGNFYGQHTAMTMDYLSIGMIKLGLYFERHIERLTNVKYNMGMPQMLTGGAPGLNSGFAGAQLLSTSLAADLRLLAIPASVQTIPTNANNQDLVSMGLHASKKARDIIDKVWKILAVEMLTLAQAADIKGVDIIGKSSQNLYREVRKISKKLENDRPLYQDIANMTAHIKKPEIQEKIFQYLPKV